MNSSRFALPLILILLSSILLSGCADIGPIPSPGPDQIGNPASSNCVNNGGKLIIVTQDDGSQIGICTFPSGLQCEEWSYLRGECPSLGSIPSPLLPFALPTPSTDNSGTYSAPSAPAAPPSLWQQIISSKDPSALLPICLQFSDPRSHDICKWFAAGATGDKTMCQGFADTKYVSFCTQELNGQSACSPSQCAHCASLDSCQQFPTCHFDDLTLACAQWSALSNPSTRAPAPAPTRVGGVS